MFYKHPVYTSQVASFHEQKSLTTAMNSREAGTFFEIANNRIGGKYKKVRYVEYTDDKFTKVKERTEQEKHLGIMGKIYFKLSFLCQHTEKYLNDEK